MSAFCKVSVLPNPFTAMAYAPFDSGAAFAKVNFASESEMMRRLPSPGMNSNAGVARGGVGPLGPIHKAPVFVRCSPLMVIVVLFIFKLASRNLLGDAERITGNVSSTGDISFVFTPQFQKNRS